jgi:hypothetical protein
MAFEAPEACHSKLQAAFLLAASIFGQPTLVDVKTAFCL